jgi:hypothetical protein
MDSIFGPIFAIAFVVVLFWRFGRRPAPVARDAPPPRHPLRWRIFQLAVVAGAFATFRHFDPDGLLPPMGQLFMSICAAYVASEIVTMVAARRNRRRGVVGD